VMYLLEKLEAYRIFGIKHLNRISNFLSNNLNKFVEYLRIILNSVISRFVIGGIFFEGRVAIRKE